MIRTPIFCVGDRVLAPSCTDTTCRCGNQGGPGVVVGEYAPDTIGGMYLVALDADPARDLLFNARDLRREPTV